VSVSGLRFKSSQWLRASLQPATLLGLMMIAACWIGVGVGLEMERGKTMDTAVQQTANLARLFEENTVRTFEGVDRGLLLLREVYERDPVHFNLSEWTKRTALVSDLTFQLSVIGADGFAVTSTLPNTGNVYVGDREPFLAQAHAKTDDLFISSPDMGRFSGRWSIQVSRRLRHPDGNFAGTIVASLDPGFVERFFETIDLGPQGSVVLRSRDGVILASHGLERASVGRTVLQSSLVEALARGPAGHYWGGGAIDGVDRLVSYRAADKYPLLVMLGITESTVFETYRRSRFAYVTIESAVTVLILFAIVAGIRHQLRLDRIRDDLTRLHQLRGLGDAKVLKSLGRSPKGRHYKG
jgi:Cache domain